MRNFNQTERTKSFASIGKMTMKTSSLLTTILTILSFAAILDTTAHAESFNSDSTSTKHGLSTLHTASTSADYAKFLWLCSGDNQQDTSVNHIVVSLADQRLYAYHDQQLVAWSNISSGRPGHETPTGTFTVSEKDVDHHSNLYNNAPMPYFMRLTDEGVGLHAGQLPGYPASHGCVRLPLSMARELYQHVESGTSVEITSNPINPTVAQNQATSTPVHLAQN